MLHYSARNLESTVQHPHVVLVTLTAECDEGFLSGPHNHLPLANFICCGLIVVPKNGGCWELTGHMLAPLGKSVNDSFDKTDFTMKYPSVDTAIVMIETL